MRRAPAMRGHGRAASIDLQDTQNPLRRFLRRNLVGASGLAIIGFAAATAAALATWTITDPSLNHATDEPVRNALGVPGAILADVLMQTIGLATAIFLAPVVLWGWRLLAGRALRIGRKRFAAWVAGTLFAAGSLAALPMPDTWPLPIGLGGFLGDAMYAIPAKITGNFTEGAATIIGALGMGLPAAFFMISSAGWFRDAAETEPVATGHGKSLEDELGLDEDDDDGDSRISAIIGTSIGAVTHWALLGMATFRRMTGRANAEVHPHDDDLEDNTEPNSTASGLRALRKSIAERLMPTEDDGLDAHYPAGQRQDLGKLAPEDEFHEAYDEDDDIFEEEDPDRLPLEKAPLPAPVGIAGPASEQPTGRVVPAAPRPKQGRRVVLEAQPSLLTAPEEYELPPLRLLAEPKASGKIPGLSADALEQNARILEGVLEDFGVRGEIIEVRPGPVVTLYELEPAPGIKSSRVIGLADDIARSMSAISARVAVIPGKNAIGIELPNSRRETVYLRELLAAQDFEKSKSKLALALGKTINGESVVADLARMPHLLVAGTTGSGKSVSINTMILSLLYRLNPEQCKMIMIDPKMLELSIYDGIPHLLTPVVTDPKKAVVALKWTVREMEDRYKKMSKMGVRNIDGYNTRIMQALEKGESFTRTVQTGFDKETGQPIYEEEDLPLEKMPYIVVIVDEMADLMMVAGKDIEGAIQRLAQMARAAGIHLIMATQRPSVDVITGTIKANFPTRISFQVTSKIDSRTILGEMGAEQLLGMGDMLFMAGGGRIQRVHGPFVSDDEVEQIVGHLKLQGTPQYLESVTEEDEAVESAYDGGLAGGDEGNDLYDKAVAIVLRDKKASTSYIQRRLSIGYNRAASLIERMEQEGLIGPANHAGKREILVQNGVEDDI